MKTLIWPVAICVLLSGALSGQFAPEVILEIIGGNTGDGFGYSVAGGGDVDFAVDGIEDVIAAALGGLPPSPVGVCQVASQRVVQGKPALVQVTYAVALGIR